LKLRTPAQIKSRTWYKIQQDEIRGNTKPKSQSKTEKKYFVAESDESDNREWDEDQPPVLENQMHKTRTRNTSHEVIDNNDDTDPDEEHSMTEGARPKLREIRKQTVFKDCVLDTNDSDVEEANASYLEACDRDSTVVIKAKKSAKLCPKRNQAKNKKKAELLVRKTKKGKM